MDMSLTVSTQYGKVNGFESNGLNKWFGIPFAKPPVGELRFRRAQEPDPWEGTLECSKMSDSPLSFGAGQMGMMARTDTPKSEDCLYLNIWAPKQTSKSPVFVWIYGGANHMGESAIPDYDLSSFAKSGIIGVSFNYRLGPLGFYNFHELDPSFDSNCAVSDMIAALKWVHENIEAFGGDPENVTICGESAGGTAVYSLLAAPSAAGYYQKAIPMSGLAGNVTTQLTHDINNKLFFDAIGLKESEVAKLRELPYETLLKGAAVVINESNKYNQGIFITGPVIDDLVPDYPWEMIAKGSAKDVKCLIGTCKNEGGLFYMMKLIPRNWNDIASCVEKNNMPELTETFKKVYAGMNEKQAAQAWATDRMFWVDAMRCALAQSRYNTVYSYRFDFIPFMGKLLGIGPTHSMDILPGLNNHEGSQALLYKFSGKKRVEDIHNKLHSAFVAFAKTGDPNNRYLPEWSPFEETKRTTMLMDDRSVAIENANIERYKAWESVLLYK